jgi:hypothetical protein
MFLGIFAVASARGKGGCPAVWRLSSGQVTPSPCLVQVGSPWQFEAPPEELFVFFVLTPEYRLCSQQRSSDPGFNGVYGYSNPF